MSENKLKFKIGKKIQIFLLLLLIILIILSSVFNDLPTTTDIMNYQPPNTVNPYNFNWNQQPGFPVYAWVPLNKISPWLQKAVIISEDDMFYQHNGINFTMLKEAFRVNLKKRRYARGASTITMQLARNAFLHRQKTLLRKLREIIITRRLEKHLSKQRILEHYLNIVEWGNNIYGVEAASRYYFGKSAANLTIAEASLLASMLPNPKYFNPYKRMKSCKRMQKRVLWLMQNARAITPEMSHEAFTENIYLRGTYHSEAEIDSEEEAKYLIPIIPDMNSAPRMNAPNSDSLIQFNE